MIGSFIAWSLPPTPSISSSTSETYSPGQGAFVSQNEQQRNKNTTLHHVEGKCDLCWMLLGSTTRVHVRLSFVDNHAVTEFGELVYSGDRKSLCVLNTAGLLELSLPDRCGRGGEGCLVLCNSALFHTLLCLPCSGQPVGSKEETMIRRPDVLKDIRAPQSPNLIGGHQKFSSVLNQESAAL